MTCGALAIFGHDTKKEFGMTTVVAYTIYIYFFQEQVLMLLFFLVLSTYTRVIFYICRSYIYGGQQRIVFKDTTRPLELAIMSKEPHRKLVDAQIIQYQSRSLRI